MQQRVRIIDMVIDYGRPRAAAVVKKAVLKTIKETQKEMKTKKYYIQYRDIIPERLGVSNPAYLSKKCKDGHWSCIFYAKELKAMRKTMPAFDKYFNVIKIRG